MGTEGPDQTYCAWMSGICGRWRKGEGGGREGAREGGREELGEGEGERGEERGREEERERERGRETMKKRSTAMSASHVGTCWQAPRSFHSDNCVVAEV